jgi:catechol 2,3-dioxygenase-like lactoylglutathione lyase family enzyme
MIETEGLTHIHLVVGDMSRSLAFYTRVFGMEELFREGDDLVFLRTPGAWDTITLNSEPGSERGRPGESGGIAHFGFRLKRAGDMDAAVQETVAAGGRLIGRGEHSPGELFAYVSDPDGYTIELDAFVEPEQQSLRRQF